MQTMYLIGTPLRTMTMKVRTRNVTFLFSIIIATISMSINYAYAQIGPNYDPVQIDSSICQTLGLALNPNECNDTTIQVRFSLLLIAATIAIIAGVIILRKLRRRVAQIDFNSMTPPITEITKTQFMILHACYKGIKKPRDIERYLSLDEKEVVKELNTLKAKGYLTERGKLTSKGLEMVTGSSHQH